MTKWVWVNFWHFQSIGPLGDAFYKSKCPSVCPSVCLCVCVSVCVFTFEVPFHGLFAPTSRSRMFNIFRDSESLGKTNGRKGSQIWTFLFENCLKSPRKKSFFFTFFGLLRFLVFFNGLFAPLSRSRMSNIFRDSESLGKSNGKKWSQIWTFLIENCLKSPRKKSLFFSLFSLLRYRLTVILPPLLKVGCPIFLEIRNPWGKVMERSGLRYEHFCLKIV